MGVPERQGKNIQVDRSIKDLHLRGEIVAVE